MFRLCRMPSYARWGCLGMLITCWIASSAVAQEAPAKRPMPPIDAQLKSDNYPASARRQGIQGRVLVEFTITAKGRTTDIKVVKSEPEGIFDDAVRSAMRGIKFTVPEDWEASGGDKQPYTLSYVFKLNPCSTENCSPPKQHEEADDWLMLSVPGK